MVTVSPDNAVEIFVPPAIIKVSFAALAVVVPVSALTVSNKFCVVPPPQPPDCWSFAGSHLLLESFHFRTCPSEGPPLTVVSTSVSADIPSL